MTPVYNPDLIKRSPSVTTYVNDKLVNSASIIPTNKGATGEADELQYREEFSINNMNDYDKIKYLIKKKIEVYNLINLMKKEERKKHLEKFVLFNNYLKNGLLSLGLKELDSPNKILTKTEEVINLKQKMKMNIILSIITNELKELFILQQAYLKDQTVKDSFYDDFDFYRQWLFFCVCVYNKIMQTHKNNGSVKKEDIFIILENVKKNNVDFIETAQKDGVIDEQPIVNVTDTPGTNDNAVERTKTWGTKLKAMLSNTNNKFKQLETNFLANFVIKPAEDITESTSDCVKKLFVEFMYILYLYEYKIDKFPLTININNPGDSSNFQDWFDEVIATQSNYYNRKFDDIIKIEYLKAEYFNTTDKVDVLKRTNQLQDSVNKSITELNGTKQTAPLIATSGGGDGDGGSRKRGDHKSLTKRRTRRNGRNGKHVLTNSIM
jgi:hypothetical protein